MSNIKQIIAIIVIISIIIIVDIIIGNNTKSVVSQMNDALENIDNMIVNNEETQEVASDLVIEWEEKEKMLSYYMEHDELEKIGSNILLIQKQIEIEALDDARQSISETQFLFESISEKQSFNLENFF